MIKQITPLGSSTTHDLSARYMHSPDTRATVINPNELVATKNGIQFDFKQASVTGLNGYSGVLSYRPYASNSDWSGGPAHQIAFNNSNGLYWRVSTGDTTWGDWKQLVTNSGTWGISITGNAATATTATSTSNDSDGNAINTTYLKRSGGQMTGNITGNSTATIGTTAQPFHQLVLGGATTATMTAASTNPRITFQEGTGTQPVHLIYSDYDSYRSPAGLKIIGGASATPAWLEVEGNVYAAAFKGNADTATKANITTTAGAVAYYSDIAGTFANDADFTWDATNNILKAPLFKGHLYNAQAMPNGKSDLPFHNVATFTQSVASAQINTKISFLVTNFFSIEAKGILDVSIRWESGATTPAFIRPEWMVASSGIDPNNFIVTWAITDAKLVTIKLYAKLTGWYSFNFTKLSEHNWGSYRNEWVLNTAFYGTAYTVASIPTGETQVVSTLATLKNSAAGSASSLTTARTIWGQSFNGTANISGNMTDMGPSVKLPSGQTTWTFLTSTGGAGNANFGKIGSGGTYAQLDLTNFQMDVHGPLRVYSTTTNNRVPMNAGLTGLPSYGSAQKYGTIIYSNGISMRDPYTGAGNDCGFIRHNETTTNSGELEIGVGDDGTEQIVARKYNTSSAVVAEIKLLDASHNTVLRNTLPVATNTYTLGNSSYRWKSVHIGTADSYGGANQPIYWSNGVPVEATAYSGLLTAFSSSTNTLSITVGGTTKTTTAVNSVSNTWANGTAAGPTIKTTVNGVAGTAVAIPSATASISGVVTTGVQSFAGGKTFKYTTRIYPQIGATSERSQWYKITFPYYNAETTSSAKWFMNSFDLHFGGGYSSNASGVAHVSFYWTRAANNGAWSAAQVSAIITGIYSNKINLYYRIAEPGVLYVNNASNNYNGIWLDNLYVDDTSPSLDWSTITIATCAAITSSTSPALSDYTVVPTTKLYTENGTTLKTNVNFEGQYIKGTWLYTSAATAKTTTSKIATIESDNYIYYITPQNLRNTMGLGNTTGALPTANGGTGNTSFTANRLIYSESATKLSSAASLYATSTALSINKTSITSGYNFEVVGNTRQQGDLLITPSQDATLKVYDTTNTTYGNETIAIQSCFDNQDPESSAYTNSYEARCNLLLQPRGGQVYISDNISNTGNTNYSLLVNGRTRLDNTTASSTTNETGQLVISNTNGGNVALELWRASNASWQLANESGTLFLRNNYTTAKQSTYTQTSLAMDYNTGNAALAGSLSVGQTSRNTSYKLYINGTSYFNGNTTHNGVDYFANGTTYYINNSGSANLLDITGRSLGVSQTNGAGCGISLYGGAKGTSVPEYGLAFMTTGNGGKFGDVQSDWATYFTMNGANQRGWIWKQYNQTGTAYMTGALSSRGVASFKGLTGETSYVAFPQGGTYTTSTATITGALKITLPQYKTNTMMSFDVNIYTYDGTNATTTVYHISGYEYGNSGWHNPVCRVYSEGTGNYTNLKVRFGYDGSKACVTIGEVNTAWSYPQVAISNIYCGYNTYTPDKWGYGWVVGFVTELPSTISGDRTAVNTQSINITGNAASASSISATGGTTAKFWRGDNTWSDTISGGTLKITNQSNTLTIGSRNASWAHFENSADIPFYFNKQINAVTGFKVYDSNTQLKEGLLILDTAASDPSTSAGARIQFAYNNNGSQPVYISYTPNDSYHSPAGLKVMGGSGATPAWFEVEGHIYLGTTGNRSIYYKGTKATNAMITFLDNTSDGYGNGIKIGGGGAVVIGAGESAANLSVTPGTENLYCLADGTSYFYSTADTVANRRGFRIENGNVVPTAAEANKDNTYNLGASGVRWANAYITTTHGALDGNASTATTLQTARTINGTSFNGSANITTANWGTARNIYIADNSATNTGPAVSVNGSANATLKLPATIKATLTGAATDAANTQSNYGAKSFIVEGDANTYYPTLITNATSHNAWTLLNISRGYAEQAPDTWNTSTHRGGLTMTILTNGDTAWGGNHQIGIQKLNTILDLSQSYCTMVGDILCTKFGLVVWLRGGTAKYWITSNGGQSVSTTTYYESHTQSTDTVAPITTVNTTRIDSYRWNNLWTIKTASQLATSRTIALTGDVTGSGSFNGSANLSIATSVSLPYGATLPSSGTEGKVFLQTSAEYYELPTGGAIGQVLAKKTAADRSVQWINLPATGINVSSSTAKFYPIGTTSNSNGAISTAAFNSAVYVQNNVLFGAAWNDYAEFRQKQDEQLLTPGQCVKEVGDGTLTLATQRLERGCEIISDTYGFAIGKTDDAALPVAVTGRVLAFPYESIEEFSKHIGWPVCSGPNGTVSIMTEEEEEKYPSRIIGTISEIPTYETWGENNIEVNGRVWIRIK